MSAITMRFEGVYDDILNAMTKSGLVASKAEAVRLALFNLALDRGLVSDKFLFKYLQKEFSKNPISPEELFEAIEDAKRKTIRR